MPPHSWACTSVTCLCWFQGASPTLLFVFSGGNSEDLFSLSSSTGELRLTRDLSTQTAPLYHSLSVTATDSGLPPLAASVKVPTFLPGPLLTAQLIPQIALFQTEHSHIRRGVLVTQNHANQESECQRFISDMNDINI